MYTSTIAGQTPCYTTPAIPLSPPSSTSSDNPSVTIINDRLFTLRYQLAKPKSKLSRGAIAGIAIGAVAGLLTPVLVLFLILRARKRPAEAKSATAAGSATQADDDNKPGAMFGGANQRPILETVSSYVPELPSPPPSSPPPNGKWEGNVPPQTPRSVRSVWSPSSEHSPDGAEVPPVPAVELPGSTSMNEHHPAFNNTAVEKGESEETGIAK